jgi:hypothetical protein
MEGHQRGISAGPLVVGLMVVGIYANLPLAFEVSLVAALVSALMTMRLPKPGRTSGATSGLIQVVAIVAMSFQW